jgi:hypothetical protein
MAKKHGARQQKRIAKQKARRQEKRSLLARRGSKDPTIRLQRVEKWPIVQAYVSTELWDEGIGYAVLARQEPEGEIIYASFLVDVLCLGVKDAFWRADTMEGFRELIQEMENIQSLRRINPACLAKIVLGAVDFAQSFGFSPHPDFRHASRLLEGIDPSTCRERYTFGEDGRPYYIQGPNETPAQAMAIVERMQEVGGLFQIGGPAGDVEDLVGIEEEPDEDEADDDDVAPGGSRWTWRGPGPGGRR